MKSYCSEIDQHQLRLNQYVFDAENLTEILKTTLPQKKEIHAFLVEWYDKKPTLLVHTSGSTGKPKAYCVQKKHMIASALMTCQFLNLQPQDTALLCLPVYYIAGKMMLVRAMVAQLQLNAITPTSSPFQWTTSNYDFAALTPMQVYQTLKHEKACEVMQNVRQLIIGGGPIDEQLENKLHCFPKSVWSTYGMTETVSHIALRRLNGDKATAWYTPMSGVKIRLSTQSTLIIDAPKLNNQCLTTNDLAVINEKGEFKIRGRLDTVINSGGIKIQIEEVEAKLRKYTDIPFMITAQNDTQFGQIVVALTTAQQEELEELKKASKANLPAYWQPKYYYLVEELPMTTTGKPNRKFAFSYVCSLLQNK